MYHAAMSQRILIIDDDARLRELLLRYLSEQGFAAKAVEDGSALDKALKLNHYHLLVLDLMLPGEDGLAILRRLRGAGENVPVILLTAKGDEVDRIVEAWSRERADLDFSPLQVLSRVGRLARHLETAEREGHPGPLERLRGGDPLGRDLQAEHGDVGAHLGESLVQFEGGGRGCPVPEVDDQGIVGRAEHALRRDPPVDPAQAVHIRRAPRDATDRATHGIHSPARLRFSGVFLPLPASSPEFSVDTRRSSGETHPR